MNGQNENEQEATSAESEQNQMMQQTMERAREQAQNQQAYGTATAPGEGENQGMMPGLPGNDLRPTFPTGSSSDGILPQIQQQMMRGIGGQEGGD